MIPRTLTSLTARRPVRFSRRSLTTAIAQPLTATKRTLKTSTKAGFFGGVGAAFGLTHRSASEPRSPHDKRSRDVQTGVEAPANRFCFNPLVDFPLDRKVLITENVPVEGDEGIFEQRDSMHGTGGAVTMSFDAKSWTPTGPSTKPQPNWAQSQMVGDGSFSPDRPLRLAVASSGIRKNLISHISVHGHPYVFWSRFQLPNFAIPGEDTGGLTGEDAVAVGHCSTDDSDTRYEYVPINKQNSALIDKLLLSLEVEDQIERARYAANRTKYPKDHPLQGIALLNDLSEPFGDRAALSTLVINDTNPQRIKFRKEWIENNPALAAQLLTDEQLIEIRGKLRDPQYEGMFLNTLLPLPVVTPAHSLTQKVNNNPYDDNDFDFASLTTNEVFGNMGKDQPLMSAAVIAVSDGVGGMVSYGDKNNTKEMSHLLMRSVRHNLTNDTKTSARDLLGQAFTSVLRHNEINLGACTASIGVMRPAEPEEPEDEFDDGRRLRLSVANLGDSTVFAFRPKHNHDFGTTTYVPLAMAWPLHHSGNSPQLPPLQLTIFDYQNRPNPAINPAATSDMGTTLSTSHFTTPTTQPNSGPSGGANFFTSKVDYLKILAGKRQLSDLFDHLAPTPTQAQAINRFAEVPSDLPWMAQSFEDVTLRRGDIICAMSDGITDNILANKLTTPAELWESVVSYVHPAIRAQHPATRNVRPFRQVPGKKLDHLSGAILCKFNKTITTDALATTDDILSKIAETQIPEFDPEVASKPYVSLRPIPSHEAAIILDQSQDPPQLLEQHIPPPAQLTPEQNEQLYKYNYVSTEGLRYHSTLTGDTESVVAGTLSSAMAGTLVRFSQRGTKLDDMSAVVAVVY